MPKVNTQHSQYLANVAIWSRCRDFVGGSDKVKDAGETYLPKLGGQDNDSYKAYKGRAQFYNASGRTVEGMAGLVMRVDPNAKLTPSLVELENDADYRGTSLYEFAKNEVTEVLTVGRSGILVDYPSRPENIVTVAQAKASGLRPYLAHYPAESIYNWKTQRVNGVTVLTMVVLLEMVETDTDDEFVSDIVTQFRVLDLDEQNFYRQRLFRKGQKDGEWVQEGDDVYPLRGGKKMQKIQFVFNGSETNTPDVQKPPILDLVNVNLGHYRNSADHEHGLHFTALPTPVITGHRSPPGEVIAIGSESFLVLSETGAEAFYMEFNGAGLEPMQSAMDKKERQMATLGARMLAEDKKGVEAEETARIHRSGEGGVLGSLVGSVSKGIRRALRMAAEWANDNADAIEFDLNKDFMPTTMQPQLLKELLQAWQSGAISMPVLFDNMKRGELIRPEVTLEDMQADIDGEMPGLRGSGDNLPGAGG